MFVASPTHISFPSPVTSLSATLTGPLQLIEKAATLSPFAATLTSFVIPKSLVCHSYEKHPGWGSRSSNQNPAVLPAPNRKSPASTLVLSLPQVTSHQSRITKSFTIRTYEKTEEGVPQ